MLPTCHTTPTPTNLKDSTIAFQMAEEFGVLLSGFRAHSSEVRGKIHFQVTKAIQRFSTESSCHPNLAENELEKVGKSCIPHPPHDLGREIFSQTTNDKTSSSFSHAHKNFLHSFLIGCRISFEIHEGVI